MMINKHQEDAGSVENFSWVEVNPCIEVFVESVYCYCSCNVTLNFKMSILSKKSNNFDWKWISSWQLKRMCFLKLIIFRSISVFFSQIKPIVSILLWSSYPQSIELCRLLASRLIHSIYSPDLAFFSPPSMPERLRIQVSRISMADYEMLHYDKDKLREACKFRECQYLYLQVIINGMCGYMDPNTAAPESQILLGITI